MELSWRGLPECIPCAAGDFCDGCDTFKKCPPNDIPGREGPRISPPMSKRFADCESCGAGQEANPARDMCIDKYLHTCSSEKFLLRCIRFCRAADPQRGSRLNRCEKMQCTMYCAKRAGCEAG